LPHWLPLLTTELELIVPLSLNEMLLCLAAGALLVFELFVRVI
jgi:hypothetical protein